MKGISLFFLLLSSNIFACKLDPQHKYISLSGPVTFYLEKLGLITDPSLKGISKFNPVDQTNFKGKVYGGGLFLSEKEIGDFKDIVVFYDSGRELKKYINSSQASVKIEVSTRNEDAFKATNKVRNLLKKYLVNCNLQVIHLNDLVKKIMGKALSFKNNHEETFLFYLGEIQKYKNPNLLIVHDGAIKSLINFNIIKTYPSNLSYVSWSQKIISKMKNIIHVGVSESRKEFIFEKITKDRVNLKFPGALTPGLSQVIFLEKVLDSGLL